MMEYFERWKTPPANRRLVAYCDGWCEEGYQICEYDESGFHYSGQPNDDFDKYVTHWAFLFEID